MKNAFEEGLSRISGPKMTVFCIKSCVFNEFIRIYRTLKHAKIGQKTLNN